MKKQNTCGARTAVPFLLFILLLYCGREAYGYLDPGTGSYIFQLLIGFFVGIIYTSKVIRRKAVNFFIRLFSGKKNVNGSDANRA
ncbi:MAG: hypothetical protein QHH14_04330, partial [Clostridiales bacterium]|nr:hypothetical protein [Clostridiales bacterium]